jgi:hypothetical protein
MNSRRLKIVFALLIVAALISYGVWTAVENTIGPCSLAMASAAAVPLTGAPLDTIATDALSSTAARALAAYGGAAAWQHAAMTESTVTIGGALFLVKGRNIPAHAIIRTDIRRPYVEINPVDTQGDVGILDGFSVTIKSPRGETIDERRDARDYLQNRQLWTRWDRLNLLYFVAYAFWGYNSLPYQLTRRDIRWTELKGSALQADYPANLPVHSPTQRFYFDPQTGLLQRNDYIALAASPGAQAANVVLKHGNADGIQYPATRRVKMTPRRYGWCLPAPDMVTIDVEKWRLY